MKLNKIATIIQARNGSSRLPNKTVDDFGDSSLLTKVVNRLVDGPVDTDIWVTTTDKPEDDSICNIANNLGVNVFRGDEFNVLKRFADCINAMPKTPDLIVRMCADRPFACYQLLKELLEIYYLMGEPDYFCNNKPISYPRGFDLEIIKSSVIQRTYEVIDWENTFTEKSYDIEEEHVTPYIFYRPDIFDIQSYTCPYINLGWVNLTIDEQIDHDSLLPVQDRLEAIPGYFTYRDVFNLITTNPELFKGNMDVEHFNP